MITPENIVMEPCEECGAGSYHAFVNGERAGFLHVYKGSAHLLYPTVSGVLLLTTAPTGSYVDDAKAAICKKWNEDHPNEPAQ